MIETLNLKITAKVDERMFNLCNVFNATMLCVCHNPTCILFDRICTTNPVFDMTDRTYKNISQYINEQSGKYIVTMTPEEYSGYIAWKTGRNNTE